MSNNPNININTKEPQRISKAYLPVFMFKNIRAWIILLLIYAAGPLVNGEGGKEIFSLGGISFNLITLLLTGITLIAIITILFSILSYQKITWQINEEEVRIRKGILRRVDKRIPIAKIQSVDLTEKLIERIFKVATVSFDTPGGSGDDGKIPCVDREVGAYIKELVFSVKNNSNMSFDNFTECDSIANHQKVEQPIPAPESQKRVIYRMPAKSLILTGLSNGRSLIFAFIILSFVTQIISTFFGDEIYDSIFSVAAKLALPILIAIIVLFLIICWGSSVIGAAITFFGFTVRNVGTKIEVEQGLMDHKTISIEKHRIQEVRISQGLIRRIIGYAEISVKTATLTAGATSSDGDSKQILGITVIHPFIKLDEINYFLSQVLPEYNEAPKDLAPLSKKAHTRSIRRYIIWTIVIELFLFTTISLLFVAEDTGASFFYFWEQYNYIISIVCIIFIAFFAITGHLSYKGRAVRMNETFITIRKGAWGRLLAYIPRRKIQIAKASENPFQRISSLATIKGTTGAHAFPTLMDTTKSFAYDFIEWSVTKRNF